jgi:hypothetical protein
MSTDAVDTARLEESLRRCRLELAAARERDEVLSENQAAADRARDQLAELARNLDARLTRYERRSAGLRGWVKRRLIKTAATPQEVADALELRRSRLFDGVWYLSTYPEVARSGLSPALHYLRHGAAEGKDPGPEFSTNSYSARHPQIVRTGANPLLNHLRTGQ